jgi:N-acetyl-anhydromuramyl-L-alanine amidase AmpD
MISLNKFSLGLLQDTKEYAWRCKIAESEALNLKDIISVNFPEDQYYKQQTLKKQIVLHHTVSGQGTDGDISWWRSTADRVGTAVIIGWDGRIYQCFSSIYWAHHLGTHAANNQVLNMSSIGVEIDAWGALIKVNGKWYPASWDVNLKKNIPNVTVKPIQNVQEYPQGFKGFYGFEKYTEQQICSLKKLLVYFRDKYGIPLRYNETMWNLSDDALGGEQGVWTHVSYREDKSDCHPQPELIQMLKSLR